MIANVTDSMISMIEQHFKETVSQADCAQQVQSTECFWFCPDYSCDTYVLDIDYQYGPFLYPKISITGFYISPYIQFGFQMLFQL